LSILAKAQNVHVVLEASGGYEQPAVRVLHAAGVALSVLQPSRVRAFARAKGLRAKTDPIDAAVLRAFGEAICPPCTLAPSAQQERLGELVLRRRQLLEFTTAEAHRCAHYRAPLTRRQAAATLRMLRRQIAQCEEAIAALIALCGERAVGGNRAAGNKRVGAAVTPGSLDFALSVDSGLKTEDNHDMRDDEIHHTLLQKRDKRFLLLLWADKDSQDGDKGAENATLRLAAGASRVRIFKPVTNGAAPIATLGTVAPGGSVRLAGVIAIPDHPLLIEIVPAATP